MGLEHLFSHMFFSACLFILSVTSNSLQPTGLQTAWLLCPWNFPGNNTGMGQYFLLQGISLTQGLNLQLLYLLHWQGAFFTTVPPEKPFSSLGNHADYLTVKINSHYEICGRIFVHSFPKSSAICIYLYLKCAIYVQVRSIYIHYT